MQSGRWSVNIRLKARRHSCGVFIRGTMIRSFWRWAPVIHRQARAAQIGFGVVVSHCERAFRRKLGSWLLPNLGV
jgi:hypothetical protein